MLVPQTRRPAEAQFRELLERLNIPLAGIARPTVSSQTIFLRDPADQVMCERLLASLHPKERPVSTFVMQAPCGGAAMAMEAWVVDAASARVERFGQHAVSVAHGDMRWTYCGGVGPAPGCGDLHAQTVSTIRNLCEALKAAGSGIEHVVRTWFYLGSITGSEGQTQRYKELNRGRTDAYNEVKFLNGLLWPGLPRPVYPASTGIGMAGLGLVAGCTSLQTTRKDAFLLPLENPAQTPAYDYAAKYSPQSPKFSRAMALVTDEIVVTWISGTASIVNSETLHEGDIEKQTHQTIDNIEGLIAPSNFAQRGVAGAGASLRDLAKVRVYVKRAQDYEKCRTVCEQRFGRVPVIYAMADVCRPELLVEIEGVAFSARQPHQTATPGMKDPSNADLGK